MSHNTSTGPVVGVVDEGALGNAAVHLAARLAAGLGRRAIAAAVVPPRTPGSPRLERAAVDRGRALLRRSAAEVDRPLRTALLVGEPVQSIGALVDREGASMVVITVPDASAWRETTLGHAYLGVMRTLDCPVVVIPPGVGSLAWSTGAVAAATVGSEPSLGAAAVATRLAEALDTTFSYVRVRDEPGGDATAAALRRVAATEPLQLLAVEAPEGDGDAAADRLVSTLARECPCPVVVVPAARSRPQPRDTALSSSAARAPAR